MIQREMEECSSSSLEEFMFPVASLGVHYIMIVSRLSLMPSATQKEQQTQSIFPYPSLCTVHLIFQTLFTATTSTIET
jgi:hypothetical protein